MSHSILNLAQADAAAAGIQSTAADQHLQWLQHQLTAWQTEFDAAANPQTGPEGAPIAGGPKPPAPHMAHPAVIPGPTGNIQPHISDVDNMQGTFPRRDPDSHFAADHGPAPPS